MSELGFLKNKLIAIRGAKKPVHNAGDWYTERARQAEELSVMLEIAKLEKKSQEHISRLTKELELAMNTGD